MHLFSGLYFTCFMVEISHYLPTNVQSLDVYNCDFGAIIRVPGPYGSGSLVDMNTKQIFGLVANAISTVYGAVGAGMMNVDVLSFDPCSGEAVLCMGEENLMRVRAALTLVTSRNPGNMDDAARSHLCKVDVVQVSPFLASLSVHSKSVDA